MDRLLRRNYLLFLLKYYKNNLSHIDLELSFCISLSKLLRLFCIDSDLSNMSSQYLSYLRSSFILGCILFISVSILDLISSDFALLYRFHRVSLLPIKFLYSYSWF